MYATNTCYSNELDFCVKRELHLHPGKKTFFFQDKFSTFLFRPFAAREKTSVTTATLQVRSPLDFLVLESPPAASAT